MPAALVDTSHIILDETEERYLASKKPSTSKAYRSSIRRFKAFYPQGVAGLIQKIEQDVEDNKTQPTHLRIRPGEELLRGYVDWHSEVGYSNKAVHQAMAALQNALKYYGVTVSLSFVDMPPDRPMKSNKKHEWTLDQIRQFVEAAEYLRDKCFILFAFQSGLSISDILNINYGDIQREYEEGIMPLAIRGYRQKTGSPIRTFIGGMQFTIFDFTSVVDLTLDQRTPSLLI